MSVNFDQIAEYLGTKRLPGETDEQLRTRLEYLNTEHARKARERVNKEINQLQQQEFTLGDVLTNLQQERDRLQADNNHLIKMLAEAKIDGIQAQKAIDSMIRFMQNINATGNQSAWEAYSLLLHASGPRCKECNGNLHECGSFTSLYPLPGEQVICRYCEQEQSYREKLKERGSLE